MAAGVSILQACGSSPCPIVTCFRTNPCAFLSFLLKVPSGKKKPTSLEACFRFACLHMTLYLSWLSPNACKHDVEIEGMPMDFSLERPPSCFKLGQNAKAKILLKWFSQHGDRRERQKRRPCADPGQAGVSAIRNAGSHQRLHAVGKGREQVSLHALISDFWPSEPVLSHVSFYSIPSKLLCQLCNSDLHLLAVRSDYMNTYWLIIVWKSAHLTCNPVFTLYSEVQNHLGVCLSYSFHVC